MYNNTRRANIMLQLWNPILLQDKWHNLKQPTWWCHDMEQFPHYWTFVRGIPSQPWFYPTKGQWYFINSNFHYMQWGHMSVSAFQTTGISTDCLTVCSGLEQRNNMQKIRVIGPLWGESTSYWWIPITKGQLCGRRFHTMTSLWS